MSQRERGGLTNNQVTARKLTPARRKVQTACYRSRAGRPTSAFCLYSPVGPGPVTKLTLQLPHMSDEENTPSFTRHRLRGYIATDSELPWTLQHLECGGQARRFRSARVCMCMYVRVHVCTCVHACVCYGVLNEAAGVIHGGPGPPMSFPSAMAGLSSVPWCLCSKSHCVS